MRNYHTKKQCGFYAKRVRIVPIFCALLFTLVGCTGELVASEPVAVDAGPALVTEMDITLYLPNQEGTRLIARQATVGGAVQDGFDAWRIAMEMPEDVTLIGYDFDNHGYETHTTFSGQPVAGYVMGDRFTSTLDLSQAFAAQLTEQNEALLMQALVNTLASWHGADKLKESAPVFEYLFLVEGQPLVTSLADYSQPQYPVFPDELQISSRLKIFLPMINAGN